MTVYPIARGGCMRRVVRCPARSSCARVAGCSFVARARLWCTELGRWVDADDGRAFGERGEPGAGVVPLDVEVGQYKPGTPGEEW